MNSEEEENVDDDFDEEDDMAFDAASDEFEGGDEF